jgi:hypothetical protein
MTRTNNKSRNKKSVDGPISRGTPKDVDNQQPKKESKKARRGKKRAHTITEGDLNSATQPAKRAKTSPDPNDSSHVSPPEPTNESTLNSTNSQTKPSQPPKSGYTPSPIAPPIYGDLASTYSINSISILTSSKISKKTTSVLEKLSQYPTIPPAKPVLVFLHSKAVGASKLITIVEIAKREVAAKGGKWFQYNALSQVMEERKREEGKGEEKDGMDLDEEEDEKDSFEVMKTPFERAVEGTPKIRAVPIMATYLSRVRIESLRKRYG